MIKLNPKGLKIKEIPPTKAEISFTVDLGEELNKLSALVGKSLCGYVLSLSKPRKKSLTANSYMWILCDRISHKVNIGKEEVYKEAIKQAGTFDDVLIKEEAYESFAETWSKDHIGYFTEIIGYPKIINGENWLNVRTYYGSSEYTSQELSRVVDYVVDEAKRLKIETMSDKELKELLSWWKI